jgi:hypothetical protein
MFDNLGRILRLTMILLLVLLLVQRSPPFRAQSQQSTNSGSFQLVFENQAGTSVYTILYSYPANVQWGNNLTITTTVEVKNLTGLELYLKDYGITATVSSTNGFSVIGQILGGAPETAGAPSQQPTGIHLFQGSRWGPLIIQIPVNRAQFGNPTSQTLNASITLQFIGDVQNDRSANSGPGVTHYDIGSRIIGSLDIRSGNDDFLPYYLYAGILGVAIATLVILRRSHRI